MSATRSASVSPCSRNPGLQRDLRLGRKLAEVPDDRGEHVASGVEIRREIDGLIAPVEEIAARRSPGDTASVHE